MTEYLIKSGVSLAVLLLAYHSLLEREKMHDFNRCYLLGGLLFSLLIPFFSYNSQDSQADSIAQFYTRTLDTVSLGTTDSFWVDMAFWIYCGITLILLSRFGANLLAIAKRISNNPKKEYNGATLVITFEKILPHTFLNYIFINTRDYASGQIEKELYTHELTHARQKHTVDILLVELLKIVFWFNPIFIFYKKAIQLNHEFLADQNVVTAHHNALFYQKLLLSKAASGKKHYLASNLNFSLTKKRLIMMTKKTSQPKALLKKAAIIPLFAAIGVLSCVNDTVKEPVVEVIAGNYQRTGKVTDGKAEIQILAKGEAVNFKEPQFPGGLNQFYSYVAQNVQLPENYRGSEKLLVAFIVETNGSVTKVNVKKGTDAAMEKEIIRVLEASPKWKAATDNGQEVRYQFVLPIALGNK